MPRGRLFVWKRNVSRMLSGMKISHRRSCGQGNGMNGGRFTGLKNKEFAKGKTAYPGNEACRFFYLYIFRICIYTVFLEMPRWLATVTTESFRLKIPFWCSREIISLFLLAEEIERFP